MENCIRNKIDTQIDRLIAEIESRKYDEMYVSELKEVAECLSQIDNMFRNRVMYEKILPNLDCCCVPPIKAVEKTNDNFPFSS